MNGFIFYLLKSALYLTIFLGAYRFLLRGTTSFNFNRTFLICGLFLSFMLPFVVFRYNVNSFVGTNDVIQANVNKIINGSNIIKNTYSRSQNHFNLWEIIIMVYFLGVCLALFFNIKQFSHFLSIKKVSKLIDRNNDEIKIRDCRQLNDSFSVFTTIYLNNTILSETERKIIIQHESVHVNQHHWMDILLGQCAQIVLWFFPLAKVYVHYIKENHEFMADNEVLKLGVEPTTYKTVLINQIFNGKAFSFSNSFNYSQNLNRIKMMETNNNSVVKKIALIAIIPIFALCFKAFAEPKTNLVNGNHVVFVPKSDYVKIIEKSMDEINDNSFTLTTNAIDSLITTYTSKKTITDIDRIPIYKFDQPTFIYGTKQDFENGKINIVADDSISNLLKEMKDTFQTNNIKKSAEQYERVTSTLLKYINIHNANIETAFWAGTFYSTNIYSIVNLKGTFVIMLKN